MKKTPVTFPEIIKTFLTIGAVGFGGGMAILALMQEYCVNKKKWLSLDEFLHGVALGQFLGPFAVNAALFVGYRVRGFSGALVAALSFLLPSFSMIVVLSALYQQYSQLATLQAVLKGIGPVVIALILAAAVQMSKRKFKSAEPVVLMVSAFLLMVVFNLQIVVILLMALVYAFVKTRFFAAKVATEVGEETVV